MGLEWIRKVGKADLGTTPAETLVITWLAYHMNDVSNRCHPSMMTLADEAGITKRYANKLVASLKKKGLITTVTGPHGTNLYTFTFTSVGTIGTGGDEPLDTGGDEQWGTKGCPIVHPEQKEQNIEQNKRTRPMNGPIMAKPGIEEALLEEEDIEVEPMAGTPMFKAKEWSPPDDPTDIEPLPPIEDYAPCYTHPYGINILQDIIENEKEKSFMSFFKPPATPIGIWDDYMIGEVNKTLGPPKGLLHSIAQPFEEDTMTGVHELVAKKKAQAAATIPATMLGKMRKLWFAKMQEVYPHLGFMPALTNKEVGFLKAFTKQAQPDPEAIMAKVIEEWYSFQSYMKDIIDEPIKGNLPELGALGKHGQKIRMWYNSLDKLEKQETTSNQGGTIDLKDTKW